MVLLQIYINISAKNCEFTRIFLSEVASLMIGGRERETAVGRLWINTSVEVLQYVGCAADSLKVPAAAG